jgi:hypothetical protein
MTELRTKTFRKTDGLDHFLAQLNDDLWVAEKKLLSDQQPKKPLIFIVGPHRSGSTLFLQWLASLGSIAYPTNLLSRFYKSPILGARIQLLLTDERYNFRDELKTFRHKTDFKSENGKTKGPLEPNEFWFFWRRFLHYKNIDYLTDEELERTFDIKTFTSELSGIVATFDAPYALKANIMNYSIPFLSRLIEKIVFIQLKRDPITNIASGLDARIRQSGSIDQWYSLKIPEYAILKNFSPHEQVAGQIYAIDRAVTEGLKCVPEHKKMVVPYERFCESPKGIYLELQGKLNSHGAEIDKKYEGVQKFTLSREKINDSRIYEAYNRMREKL